MNFTSRMAALLAQMHRQRNGAVAASMRVYGAPCGLNYGVSLPTVRQIVRTETSDYDFACYLLLQDVRELRLVALHLAHPERLTSDQFPIWAAGIVNSEIAEEAAFALLNHLPAFPELFQAWIADPNPLLAYAVLLAAARNADASMAWIDPALEVLRRYAVSCENSAEPVASSVSQLSPASAAHLVAQGVVAFLASLGERNEENRQAVLRAAGSLGKLPTEDFVHEELAWRLEA